MSITAQTTEQPFQFVTASYLTRVDNQRARTISELRDCLMQAGDATIFYHTFQSLGRYHFLTEGFSNDFAQWVLTALNQPALAERIAGIDVRDYLSIAELRADLGRMLAEFQDRHPLEAEHTAFEPFYFMQAVEVVQAAPVGRAYPGGIPRRAGTPEPRVVLLPLHFLASAAAVAHQRLFSMV